MSKMHAAVVALLLAYLNYADASAYHPEQGFHMITNMPEAGRKQDDVYVYAIRTPTVSDGDTIEFSKEGGLPTSIVETGKISIGEYVFGCYLEPNPPKRMAGIRFGIYTATYTPQSGPVVSAHTFVKPPTKILDTRGVYTVTIYPDAFGSMDLEENQNIGVRWIPGCRKITWCKDKDRNVHKGQRLDIDSIDDAGLYTISRPGRGGKGWFAQIQVIAASCPKSQYLNGGNCDTARTLTCMNGGVGRNDADSCICPPFYVGNECEFEVSSQAIGNGEEFVLAIAEDEGAYLQCKDLPAGNENCRGFLFSYGDLYGSSCGLGWYGNNCERPCPKGRYGVNCMFKCPDSNSGCGRFFGN